MLFGSFQPAPVEKNGKLVTLSKFNRNRKDPELGYAPVWAFPITDLRHSVIHALYSCPEFPQIFYIFETDDFLRIDLVKHYQAKRDKADTDKISHIKDLETDDDIQTDDDHSEFIINGSGLDDRIKAAGIVTGIPEFLSGKKALKDIIPGTEVPADTEHAIRRAVSIIMPDYTSSIDSYKSMTGIDELSEDQEMSFGLKLLHQVFTIALLPMILNSAITGRTDPLYIFSTLTNCYRLASFEQRFIKWSEEDCTKEGYDTLFIPALDYVIDDKKVLQAIAANDLPKGNEFCPCGSGKKYKKCHGPFIGA